MKHTSSLMTRNISQFPGDYMPRNVGLYISDKDSTPPKVKYKYKQKFELKILVGWLSPAKEFQHHTVETTRGPVVNTDVDIYWGTLIEIVSIYQ